MENSKKKKEKKGGKAPTTSEVDALKKHVSALQRKLNAGGPVAKATGARKAHESNTEVAVVARNRDYVGGAPVKRHLPSGDVEVTHTEFIGTVVQLADDVLPAGVLTDVLNWNLVPKINPFGAGQVYGGAISVNAVNPLNQAMFKALSAIAMNYEKFRFTSLKFRYGNRTSTTTGGDIIMAWDMDPDDAPPSNKDGFLNFKRNVSGVPYNDKVVSIPPQDVALFINQVAEAGPASSAPAVAPEPRTCNYGSFFFAGGNVGATGQIGDLFVSYTVELYEFQNRPELQISSTWFQSIGTPIAGTSNLKPLGDVTTRPRFSQGVTLGEYVTAGGGPTQAVVFGEPGEYSVDCVYNGTGFSGAVRAATLDANGSINSENVSGIFVDTYNNILGATFAVRQMLVRIIEAPAAIAMWLDAATTFTNVVYNVAKMLPGSTTGPEVSFTVPTYLPIAPFFERELVDMGTGIKTTRKLPTRGLRALREQTDTEKVVVTTITTAASHRNDL